MKKKTILVIVAAVVIIALIAIIAVAVKNKHKETGVDEPVVTDAPLPNGDDTGDVALEEKTGPLKVEDNLYPFTMVSNDDGTLTVTMDGAVPSGFEWGDAEFRDKEFISISKESANSYKITGNSKGSDLITLPLKRIEGANEVIAEITLNIEVGRNTEYKQIGEMSENIAGEIISLPVLEAAGEIDKGVTVLEFRLEKYDIPSDGEIIYRSSESDYHSYQIKMIDDGRKYEIALDGTDKGWTIPSVNTDYYTVEGPTVTDSRVVTVINIQPRKEATEDEEVEEDEPEGSSQTDSEENTKDDGEEIKPRFMILGIVNQELNIYFELTLFANDDGTSTVCSHGASIYDVPMLTDEYIEEESTGET